MKNIDTILFEAGIQLTDEQKETVRKEMAANYRTISDYEKQTGKLNDLQAQYDGVKASLDKFDGVDLEGLKKQISDAQEAAKQAEENARKQLAARDYTDAVNNATAGLKFSSNAAKKQFLSDLTAQNLPLNNGQLLGLNDYIAAYKEQDSGAIIDAAEEKKATFTQPEQPGQTPRPRSTDYERRLAEVMGVKME